MNNLPDAIRSEEENEQYIAELEDLYARGGLSDEEQAWAEQVTALIVQFEQHYQIM